MQCRIRPGRSRRPGPDNSFFIVLSPSSSCRKVGKIAPELQSEIDKKAYQVTCKLGYFGPGISCSHNSLIYSSSWNSDLFQSHENQILWPNGISPNSSLQDLALDFPEPAARPKLVATKQPKVEEKPRDLESDKRDKRDLESDSDFESPNLLARKLVPRRPKEVKMKKVGSPPFS